MQADLGEMGSGIEQQELEGAGGWVQDDAAIGVCIGEASHEGHQGMQARHLAACKTHSADHSTDTAGQTTTAYRGLTDSLIVESQSTQRCAAAVQVWDCLEISQEADAQNGHKQGCCAAVQGSGCLQHHKQHCAITKQTPGVPAVMLTSAQCNAAI